MTDFGLANSVRFNQMFGKHLSNNYGVQADFIMVNAGDFIMLQVFDRIL